MTRFELPFYHTLQALGGPKSTEQYYFQTTEVLPRYIIEVVKEIIQVISYNRKNTVIIYAAKSSERCY